jgi:hypothetical protein
MIIEQLEQDTQRRVTKFNFEGYWHSSAIGGCQREQLLWSLGVQGLPISLEGGQIMEEGHLHELGVVSRMRDSGLVVLDALDDQKEHLVSAFGSQWPLVCHPDGRMPMGGADYTLEIKSMMWGSWKRLRDADISNPVADAFPRHYAQCHIGMAAQGTSSCLYLAKNRADGSLREEIIRFDEAYWEWLILKHLAPVVTAYTFGSDPNVLPCHSDQSVRNTCAYRHLCKEDGNHVYYPVAGLEVDDDDMKEVIEEYVKVRAAEDDIVARKENLRYRIKNFMIQNGIKKGVVGDTPVQIIQGSRKSVDYKELQGVLGDEEFNRVVRRTQYEQLRIG